MIRTLRNRQRAATWNCHTVVSLVAASARRRKTGLLLMTLDVRNLKAINDAFGYVLGDEVLRTVADALTEATRTADVVARYGGDEFAVLLLDAAPKDVDVIVARVRDKLGSLTQQRRLPVTVECSTGVACSSSIPTNRAITPKPEAPIE